MKYQEPSIVIPELESAPEAKSRTWTEDEIKILVKYRHKDPKALGIYFNRSADAITSQLKRLKDRGVF